MNLINLPLAKVVKEGICFCKLAIDKIENKYI